jgi:hypothetical protein
MMVWLLNAGLKRFNYHLPLALVTLFAITIVFTLSGFYEVLELWDDKYMHPDPGWRIHGSYDTAERSAMRFAWDDRRRSVGLSLAEKKRRSKNLIA